MRHPGAVLFAAAALLSSGCDRPLGSGERTAGTTDDAGAKAAASTGGTAAAASATARRVDDTPPAWLPPPDYTELAWDKATALIRSGGAGRVIGTRTRRAYVVTPGGEKHFTIEPRHGDLKALIAEDFPKDHLLYRDDHDEISWKDAEALIREKRAKHVFAAHFQLVTVGIGNGTDFFAIAPKDVEVAKLVKKANASGNSVIQFSME